jgi:hypothetical protein
MSQLRDMESSPIGSTRACAIAFLTAAVALATQLLFHRLVSAKFLNNYAFLVISLTMLGFATSGILLSWRLKNFLASLADTLCACAALFAFATLWAGHILCGALVPEAGNRPAFVLAFLSWIPLILVQALPFIFIGLMLGLLLAAPGLDTRRIYGWDLAGSALGALVIIPVISMLGVEAAMVLACAVLLVGTIALVRPVATGCRALVALAILALVGGAGLRERVFRMRYSPETMLGQVERMRPKFGIEYTAWDPVARIEVSRIPPPYLPLQILPSLVGTNQRFLQQFKRMLTQNNYAFTYALQWDGRRESLQGIEETIYAAAYEARSVPAPKSFVIGVGGGFDILTALYFDTAQVTGVEVNSATTKILTKTYAGYFAPWVQDPRVRLVSGEGRHALQLAPARSFDIVQLSGVDSYSGTPGAAHVFSESYLYTSEAFDLYLSRLTDAGILNVMRMEHRPLREMFRVLTTAVEALRRAGVPRPAEHVVMIADAKDEAFVAMLLKRTPFTAEELDRLDAWTKRGTLLSVMASPRLNAEAANGYQVFLGLGDRRREAEYVAAYPFDISPVSDDRPFFFRSTFWWHVFPADPLIWMSIPTMEYSVILLLAAAGIVALACIGLPLWFFAREGLRVPGAGRALLYFAGTGLGYLAIEIALMQKFGLFLGHPNYAVSVVLAAMLASSGAGSILAARLVDRLGGLRFVVYALAGCVLVEDLLLLPRLREWATLPFPLCAAIVVALVAPIGLLLGVFVPTALQKLKGTSPSLVPWAWGVNGIFSVMAPILSVAISMSLGIEMLLLAAIPVYLVVGFCSL